MSQMMEAMRIYQYTLWVFLLFIGVLMGCSDDINPNFTINGEGRELRPSNRRPKDTTKMVQVHVVDQISFRQEISPPGDYQIEWDFNDDGIIDAQGSPAKYFFNQTGPVKVTMIVDSITKASKWINILGDESTLTPMAISFINPSDAYGTVTTTNQFELIAKVVGVYEKRNVSVFVNDFELEEFGFDDQSVTAQIRLDLADNVIRIEARDGGRIVKEQVEIEFDPGAKNATIASANNTKRPSPDREERRRKTRSSARPSASSKTSSPSNTSKSRTRRAKKTSTDPVVRSEPVRTKSPSTAPVAPQPSFTLSTSSVRVGEPVKFNNNTLNSAQVKSFEWDYGDGGSSHEANPTHVYRRPGNYGVILCINNRTRCTSPRLINVLPANDITSTETEVNIAAKTPTPVSEPKAEARPATSSTGDDFLCQQNARVYNQASCIDGASALTDEIKLNVRPLKDIQLKSVVVKTEQGGEYDFEYWHKGKKLDARRIKALNGQNAPSDVQGVILRAGLSYEIVVRGTADDGSALKFWQNPSCTTTKSNEVGMKAVGGAALFNIKYCYR